MPQTIEQQRAAMAWDQVESLAGSESFEGFKKYSQLLQGLPVALHTAGLGQTVAFHRSKDDSEHEQVLTHLAAWLLRNDDHGNTSPDRLMEIIKDGDAQSYRRLSAEALAYLSWLKRFARARALELEQHRSDQKQQQGDQTEDA